MLSGARHNFNGGRVAGKSFRTTDFTDVTYLTARPTGQVGTSEWPRRSVWVQVGWKR